MRCLITGGAGFAGSHLAEGLATRGDDVLILDGDGFEELGRRRPDITAVRELTGWGPVRTLEQALGDVIAFPREELALEAAQNGRNGHENHLPVDGAIRPSAPLLAAG